MRGKERIHNVPELSLPPDRTRYRNKKNPIMEKTWLAGVIFFVNLKNIKRIKMKVKADEFAIKRIKFDPLKALRLNISRIHSHIIIRLFKKTILLLSTRPRESYVPLVIIFWAIFFIDICLPSINQ